MHGSVAIRASAKVGACLIALGGLKRLDFLSRVGGEILGDRDVVGKWNARTNLQVVKFIIDRVARNTDNGLHCHKQVIGHRTMGIMANLAVFSCGRVLVDPGPHDGLVTLRTQLILRPGSHASILMRVVTTGAAHGPFGDGMMAGIPKSGADI